MRSWYLIRTQGARERWVRDQLSERGIEIFLPFLTTHLSRWGLPSREAVVPLFPTYLFAFLSLSEKYFDVRYAPGVRGFVSYGRDPITVPVEIIEGVRDRMTDGFVVLPTRDLMPGERVEVISGPFKGCEVIFERYLSGRERVAVLLGSLESSGTRMTLPASALEERSNRA